VETTRAEVLVLGAGLAGVALADHLAERGVGPVVVYDPNTPAAGATGRAAGIVTEQLWDRGDVEMVRESRTEYLRLATAHDPSAYRVTGFARWTRDPSVAEVLASSRDQWKEWGVDARPWTASDLRAHLPTVRSDDIRDAVWSPGDAVVNPTALVELYVAEARRRGVEFLFGPPRETLGRQGSSWTLSTEGRSVRAERAVVAAGAWSKRILASVGDPLPLVPYRTQLALLRPTTPSEVPIPSVHDLDTDVYVRPEEVGRIMAGDGTELIEADPDRFSTAGDESFVAHLADTFERRFPGWRDAALVRAWAGVCTATPDRRPLIGPVGGGPGLYCITGFNGFGVMRAGGAARWLAAVIASGEADREMERLSPVLPGRFGRSEPEFRPEPGFTLEAGVHPRF
jgi:glycine/D-amino acid oxidase-like deaminating enzyme